LQSLITSTLNSNKRLYCVFIDYRKAFDSVVTYDKLWLTLWKHGVRGKVLSIIRSIYNNVKLHGKFSDFYDINIGLLQGEALSPVLFSLFINDMENELINSNCRSYQLQMLNLFILMYADDTVLFSEDIDDLQNMLNCVQRYTDKWNLSVNN